MDIRRDILDDLFLPLYVIGEEFSLKEANAAALKHIAKDSLAQIQNEKCYSLIYGRSEPCPFCPLLNEGESKFLENTFLEKVIHDTLPKSSVKSDTKKNSQELRDENIEKFYRVVFSRFSKNKKYLLESIEDVTTQKEEQNKTLLNENLSALGVMISGISHELNNALTGMGLNLQNLIANHASMDGEELKACLEISRKDLQQASRIVSDILLFSTPSRPSFTKSKILQTIHKAIATSNRLYPVLSRSVSWKVEGEEIIFPFRPENIERLLINLFRNSLQAFDYKPGYIHVYLRRRAQSVRITVEDNAGGMEKSHLKKIFQPFYTNTPSAKGSGLGLSICHRIVREHQGHIHVRSIDNRSLFYISLPLNLQTGSK